MNRRLIYFFIVALISTKANAQIVINGAVIKITGGATLVINNSSNNAIIQKGSGYIFSEGIDNKILWNIGSGNGNTYLLPFGNSDGYMPLQFTASSGSADGYFVFSTYPTLTWKNSDFLPPGVTNVNAGGSDNSAKVIDRFWQINPKGYATKPTLGNLVFTYDDNEYSAPNTITESSLIAQRWNNSAMTWSDFIPASTVNIGNNTIIISSIAGNQLFDWWTLVDAGSPLPVTLIDFNVTVAINKVIAKWQTSSEINTAQFEVYRSKDGNLFEKTGQVTAAGNSNLLLHYEFTDKEPFSGTSYYRLKTIDLDGKYAWSSIEKVTMVDNNLVALYPNPAHDYLTLQVANSIAAETSVVTVYDAKGSLIHSFKLTNSTQQINISRLSQGSYQLVIKIKNDVRILTFIKK